MQDDSSLCWATRDNSSDVSSDIHAEDWFAVGEALANNKDGECELTLFVADLACVQIKEGVSDGMCRSPGKISDGQHENSNLEPESLIQVNGDGNMKKVNHPPFKFSVKVGSGCLHVWFEPGDGNSETISQVGKDPRALKGALYETSGNSKRGEYRCSVCRKPKRGHLCNPKSNAKATRSSTKPNATVKARRGSDQALIKRALK